MDFIIKLSKKASIIDRMLLKALDKRSLESYPENILIVLNKNQYSKIDEMETPEGQVFIIGDPVYHRKDNNTKLSGIDYDNFGKFIRSVDGFYFLIGFNKTKRETIVSCSLFNILPIYYFNSGKHFVISSSFHLLTESNVHCFSTDKQYYLEKALFNYPLFNRTPFSEIKTLPANTLLAFNLEPLFLKHTEIQDYYVTKPSSWRRSLNSLSDLFIEKAGSFLPADPYYATFTGGLDGRALVGLSLSMEKEFITYSYGSMESADVQIPNKISQKIGIPYKPFIIDKEYSVNHFWEYGKLFNSRTYGLGNISRSHYSFAASKVLTDSGFLLSGNFGSEIIRSMKIPGVMISEMLFKVFEGYSREQLGVIFKEYQGCTYLAAEVVDHSMENLLDEIFAKLVDMAPEMPANMKFYIFIFECVFPKYFGPEITMQRSYINHRAPFLCFDFIKELLKTEVAGVNSDFRETNPFKRYHGQALYSHILKKTTPSLLDEKLDKGYKPRNFLTPLGPWQIGLGYFWKKAFKNNRNLDIPDFASTDIRENIDKMTDLKIDKLLFNETKFKSVLSENGNIDQLNLINMISAALFRGELGND